MAGTPLLHFSSSRQLDGLPMLASSVLAEVGQEGPEASAAQEGGESLFAPPPRPPEAAEREISLAASLPQRHGLSTALEQFRHGRQFDLRTRS